jgi:hypothetical protein
MRKLFYRGYRLGQIGDNWYRQIGSKIELTRLGGNTGEETKK